MTGISVQELEALGEEAVRKRLIEGVWNDRKANMAHRWLAERDRAAAERSQVASARYAKSSRVAAWVSAAGTIIAAIFAAAAYFK